MICVNIHRRRIIGIDGYPPKCLVAEMVNRVDFHHANLFNQAVPCITYNGSLSLYAMHRSLFCKNESANPLKIHRGTEKRETGYINRKL